MARVRTDQKAPAELRTKPCQWCGRALKPRKPSAIAKHRFCSTSCAYAGIAASHPVRQKPCVVCGGPRGRYVSGKTCSGKCGYEFRKSQKRAKKECSVCHVMFWPTSQAKYCSLACYRKVQNARPAFLTVACEQCGATVRRTAAAVKRVKHSFCGMAAASVVPCFVEIKTRTGALHGIVSLRPFVSVIVTVVAAAVSPSAERFGAKRCPLTM